LLPKKKKNGTSVKWQPLSNKLGKKRAFLYNIPELSEKHGDDVPFIALVQFFGL
jgi:hypothetical protein